MRGIDVVGPLLIIVSDAAVHVVYIFLPLAIAVTHKYVCRGVKRLGRRNVRRFIQSQSVAVVHADH